MASLFARTAIVIAVVLLAAPAAASPNVTIGWSDSGYKGVPLCPEAAQSGPAFAQAYSTHSDSVIISAGTALFNDLRNCEARYQQEYIATGGSTLDTSRIERHVEAQFALPYSMIYLGNLALILGNAYMRTGNTDMARKSYAVVLSLEQVAATREAGSQAPKMLALVNVAKTQSAKLP